MKISLKLLELTSHIASLQAERESYLLVGNENTIPAARAQEKLVKKWEEYRILVDSLDSCGPMWCAREQHHPGAHMSKEEWATASKPVDPELMPG